MTDNALWATKMQREFVEDGWRFRVTVRDYNFQPREIKVQFYKESLPNKDLEDVHSVSVTPPKKQEEVTRERFSIGPWSWTTTEMESVPYEDLEEQIEDGMAKAWKQIEEIGQSPSEQMDEAIQSVRGQ